MYSFVLTNSYINGYPNVQSTISTNSFSLNHEPACMGKTAASGLSICSPFRYEICHTTVATYSMCGPLIFKQQTIHDPRGTL